MINAEQLELTAPDAEEREEMEHPVVIVAHQIGSGANGGLQSLTEIIASTPRVPKIVVTNRESNFSDQWRRHAEVLIWPLDERTYGEAVTQDPARFAKRVIRRISNSLKLAWLIRSRQAKVVHFNESAAFWNGILGAMLMRAKPILNVRDTIREISPRFKWKLALFLCDSFLVLSQEMKTSWERELSPLSHSKRQSEKFGYIYSIVDFARFHPADNAERDALKRDLGLPADRFVIAYVARVDDKKNQLEFIAKGIPLIRARIPNALVVFVGDFEPGKDAYAAACAAEVARQQAGDIVRFAGYSPRAADWYRATDALVLASRREGLPRCVIEGLASGAPIVSFDVCSVREVLEGHDCGFALFHGDYPALADALARIEAEPALAARLRKAGPLVARSLFSAVQAERNYTDLVQRLAATDRRSIPERTEAQP